MSKKYKFNLYNIFRFHRNTNVIKQNNFEDKLKYLSKSDNNINNVSAKLDGVAQKAYNDAGKTYSERSPYNMLLTAFKEILNFMLLYMARIVSNNNILTSDNINNTRGLASLAGFEAIAKRAAFGNLILTIKAFDNDTSTLLIHNGAQLVNVNNGMQYFVTMKQDYEQFKISYNSALILTAVQGIKKEIQFTGSGDKLQTYHISDTTIDDSFLEVYVNNVRYTRVNKLTDMHFNDKAFTVRNAMSGGLNVIFGTGVNGYIPKMADTVKILYVSAAGTDGNTGANEEFEFVSGVTDKYANYVDTRSVLKIMSTTDFMGGYDGDGINEIALNAGMQTPSNTITTVDNYYSFMRKFTEIKTVDVWSEPSVSSTVNMLVMPNIRSIADRRLKTYFDLEYGDFEMDDDELSTLHSNIVGDRKYALMSNLNIYRYKLIPYAILVFAKPGRFTVPQQLYNQILTVIHEALLSEIDENAQLIRASKITSALQSKLPELNELNVKFAGNSEYINVFGDIDTQNRIIAEGDEEFMAIPYIFKGTYDGVDFSDIPVKVLTQNTNNQWIELNYTND